MHNRFLKHVIAGSLVFAALFMLFLGTQPVQAFCTFNGTLSSSTITQGTSSATVTGTDGCDTTLNVSLNAGICGSGGSTIFSAATTTDVSGDFSQNIPTSSLSLGSYCVVLQTCTNFPCTQFAIISDPLTVTAAIPEYSFGLPLLAIFMVIAYGVIRRRTKNPRGL